MKTILIAEIPTEKHILAQVLQLAGAAVMTSSSLDYTLRDWSENPADLLMISKMAAIESVTFIHQIRQITIVPLILLANPLSERLHIELLEAGADLVLQRPYSTHLLVSQIRTLLRRSYISPISTLMMLGQNGWHLDPMSQIVQFDGRSSRLTPLEFRLLHTLVTHSKQTLTTETLIERVWGYGEVGSRELVRGLISRLRAKVELDSRHPKYILTIPGVGYSFQPL